MKTLESPEYGALVEVDTDASDCTARLNIDGQWFDSNDLRWLAKKLKKLANKLDGKANRI